MILAHSHPHTGPAWHGTRCAEPGAVWFAAIVTPLEAAGAFEGAGFISFTPQHTSVEHREIIPGAGVTTAQWIACM